MKSHLILATAIVFGGAMVAVPVVGAGAVAGGGQTVAVREDVQSLKEAVETFRTACQKGDVAGAKAALKGIVEDWKALPPAVRERILANHPELAERIAAWKQVPAEIQDLRSAVEAGRSAWQKGDAAGVKAATEQAVADFKELPPALKLLIARNHPELVERLKARMQNGG
jgi:2-oxo-4-hydroxy-4-carboxy--5-ureidoimidazoline (OHCU) decarboxylase